MAAATGGMLNGEGFWRTSSSGLKLDDSVSDGRLGIAHRSSAHPFADTAPRANVHSLNVMILDAFRLDGRNALVTGVAT